MTSLTALTIAAAREGLRKKAFSALELTDAYVAAIEKARVLNAFIVETPEKARDMAKASDARLAKGEAGALEGIPLGIKDLFATKGIHTQACSHVLDAFKPPYESTVTANLWRDGAVMLGKLNMDEFAMGSSNETSYYGNVINPWKRRNFNAALVPGGSSGGSASAVAAHICAAATATDTGGSIRQPAAFTGTVGIKPTYGRCSRWGIVAFASSLDQAGPIARDVRDAAIMLKSMASVDPKDTTSVDLPVPDYEKAIGRPIKGLRVGIPKEYRVDPMPAEIDALWAQGAAWLKEHPYTNRTRGSKTDHERKAMNQAEVSVCSILRDWIKGQVMAVETGILTFEGAFLGQILLPNGRTVLEQAAETLLPALEGPRP